MFFNVHVFGVVIPQLIRREAPYPRFHQMGTYIVIDRNGGDILRQQIFRLLIVFAPSRHVGGLRRVAQRRVVSRVAVLTGVLAITGTERIEESGGIVVIGDPGIADGKELRG